MGVIIGDYTRIIHITRNLLIIRTTRLHTRRCWGVEASAHKLTSRLTPASQPLCLQPRQQGRVAFGVGAMARFGVPADALLTERGQKAPSFKRGMNRVPP
jgi:hypothetical protein